LPRRATPAYRLVVKSRLAVLTLAAAVTAAAGCDRTLSKDDCERVGAHMRQVWDAEARAAAPAGQPAHEKAAAVIRSEGDRMSREWTDQCRKELEGQRVDEREIDCLLAAPTIAAIQECGTAR
jgi:hypothetical protein